jgi:ATP-binding cassette, subfamily C (CFTR/MRP), member 1
MAVKAPNTDSVIPLVDSRKPHALSKVLLSVYKWPFLAAIVPRLCLSGLTYAQPFLVERVILFISEPDTPTTKSIGYGLIAAYAIVYVGIGVR